MTTSPFSAYTVKDLVDGFNHVLRTKTPTMATRYIAFEVLDEIDTIVEARGLSTLKSILKVIEEQRQKFYAALARTPYNVPGGRRLFDEVLKELVIENQDGWTKGLPKSGLIK